MRMLPDILSYLLEKGAHREPKRITTLEVAEALEISQQSASRKMISLEKEGMIAREGGKVRLLEKATSELRKCAAGVLKLLSETQQGFDGNVVAGLGEGAYYLSQKGYLDQFQKKLGFRPFPGTLNVSVGEEGIEKRLVLRQQKPIVIDGFVRGNRTFGKISAYRCTLNGMPGAIVFPERSHHGLQVIEIVAPFGLRKKLGLNDGSSVRVETV